MHKITEYLVCVAISLVLVAMPAQAEERKEKEKPEGQGWVWYPTAICKTKPEKGTPGSSPETAIPVKHFSNLERFALKEANIRVSVFPGEEEFKPNCKWVRLTGFFRWLDYFDYRGTLLEDARAFYFGFLPVRYIIESFGDESTRRGNLHARRVTLVGRFYNLCAAAEREETESGEPRRTIGGLCHYGRDKGMMLTDVMIEKVHDDEPRFLSGDENREIIRELVPYEAQDIELLTRKVREWAVLVKTGAEAYFAHQAATHPLYKKARKLHGDFVEGMRKIITSPDSYVSYLNSLAAFQEMDSEKAPVAVFSEPFLARRLRENQVVGCICMKKDCTDQWPLLHRDAERFIGAAACITLNRSKDDPVWRW